MKNMQDLTELQKILIQVAVLGVFSTIAYFLRRENKDIRTKLDAHDARIGDEEKGLISIVKDVEVLRKDVDTIESILIKISDQGIKLELSNQALSINQKSNIKEVIKLGVKLEDTHECLSSMLKESQKQTSHFEKFFATGPQ